MAYDINKHHHGIEVELQESITRTVEQTNRGFAFVGTSPVNLATEPKVNKFVKIQTIEDAKKYIGYNDDYKNYTLNQVVDIFLNNPVSPVGPIYVCNVLDPVDHKGSEDPSKNVIELSFYKNVATIDNPFADINTVKVIDRQKGNHYTTTVVNGKIQVKLLPDPYKPGSTGEIKQEAKLRPESGGTNWPELYAAAGITFKDGVVDFQPDADWTRDKKLEIDSGDMKMVTVALQFPKPDPDVKKVHVEFPGAEAQGTVETDLDLSQEGVVNGDGVEDGEAVFSFSVGFYDTKTHAYFMEQQINFTWYKEDGSEIKTSYTVEFLPAKQLKNGTGTLTCWYDTVDPSKVTIEDIIGTREDSGKVTGLQAIENMEEDCGTIPTDLGIPKYSSNPEVFKAMQEINPVGGHWFVFNYASLSTDQVKTLDKAVAVIDSDEMRSESNLLMWPDEKDIDGKNRDSSVGFMAAQLAVDLSNLSIPFESASNVDTHLAGKYFGEAPEIEGFSQEKANELNAAGITTITFNNGRQVYWGTYTSAFKFGEEIDPRSVDAPVMRMIYFLMNGFQQRYGDLIDRPMSRAVKDEILVNEQAYLDSLVGYGALLGRPVIKFEEAQNPVDNILRGYFYYDLISTPATPLRSIRCGFHYSDEGIYLTFGNEEE